LTLKLTQLARSAAAIAALALVCPFASAQVSSVADKTEGTSNVLPTILNHVGVDQNLNRQLPLDAVFTDETGKQVRLGDYFTGQKPAILALVYYTCPMLCSEEMEGMTSALEMVRYQPGKDFNILAISIDPTDADRKGTDGVSSLAMQKKRSYTKRFGRPETNDGWHFLTGPQSSIDALTEAVGYHAVKVPGPDGQLNQFAHTSSIEVITSQGRMAQYFYGVEYSPKDILFALTQASGGKVGSPVEALVMYCYHYDPHTGHYSLIVARVVQLACLLTVFTLGGFMVVMFRKDAQDAREVKKANG
jgi:protein SCO1/2